MLPHHRCPLRRVGEGAGADVEDAAVGVHQNGGVEQAVQHPVQDAAPGVQLLAADVQSLHVLTTCS